MEKPKVSVILTHQLDLNRPYLRECLKGLANSYGVPYEVWLISGGLVKPEEPELYLRNFNTHWDQRLNTATLKIQKAMELISPDSTHVLLISDDVIVSSQCLSSLYQGFKGREMIMNPLSNSDSSSLYHAEIHVGDKLLTHDMDLEDFTDLELVRLRNKQGLEDKILVNFMTLSFYCTMIPKTVFQKVGALDPKLEYRHNDQDFCMRAAQMQIPSVVNFGAFAFHFGSRTLKHFPISLRDEATQHFMTKWKPK